MKKLIIILTLLSISVILSVLVFNSDTIEKSKYTNITLKDYKNKINNKEKFTIYVYKKSCVACQKMKPHLNEIIKKNNVKVYGMDADITENFNLNFFKENKLEKSPTLLKYENGKELKRIEGLHSKEDIENFLNDGEDK